MVRARVDVRTRLAVFVPMDPVRCRVIPGARSVYYCPEALSGGCGMVIDGLLFELYVLAATALTDQMLHASLLWGYLGTMKRPVDDKQPMPPLQADPDAPDPSYERPSAAESFPDTPLGQAMALVADREDEHLLDVTTVSDGEAEALASVTHKHQRFVQEKVKTRLVRVTTRYHPLFVSIVDRLRHNDKLVRNRNDPSKRAEYDCLLLVPKLVGSKTREGKWKGVPVKRLVPVWDVHAPLSQLVDQLRLSIDDFERLSRYEKTRIDNHNKERARRLAGQDFQELSPEGDADRFFDPSDLSGFVTGSSQLIMSVDHTILAPCYGTLVTAPIRMPRGLADVVRDTHNIFGTRPWLLDTDVPLAVPKMMAHYETIQFHRTMATPGIALSFKSPEQLLQELPPIPKKEATPPAPPPPKKANVLRFATRPRPEDLCDLLHVQIKSESKDY